MIERWVGFVAARGIMKNHFKEKRGELQTLLIEDRELIDGERQQILALRQASAVFFARQELWGRATAELQGSIDLIRQWGDESGRR